MGTLYLVATPIGNLEDITQRALRILGEVDRVIAEDTRHSGLLLQHFGLHKPLLSLHEHNETERIPALLRMLAEGERLALISDAGTPALSDPGYPLVRAAIAAGHAVVPIPGPSALLAGLVAAGLPTDRFLFLGFPPRKPKARREWLAAAAAERGTLILFESGPRLPALLADVTAVLGAERPVVVARELTKLYETFWRGDAAAAARAFAEPPPGEIVVLIGGLESESSAAMSAEVTAVLRGLTAGGLAISEAARLVSALTGLPRRQVYDLALQVARPGV